MKRVLCLAATLAMAALGCSEPAESNAGLDASVSDAAEAVDAAVADASTPDAGLQRPAPLGKLETYLLGKFDNQAQYDGGFAKLVRRFVCPLPGRTDADVLWFYVEHQEVYADGTIDSYYTRVNEIRLVDGKPVSRGYKFVDTHPLYANPYARPGSIGVKNGCKQPSLLASITEADLVYRDGCDIGFVEDGDVFHATSTARDSCSFPGGYIYTHADVFADGMDTQDEAVSGGQTIGELFEFRRVK